MLYVDTSVIVSALTKETDIALSQIWLAGQEASELTISDWTAFPSPSGRRWSAKPTG
jgi:uncharacterized protein